MVNPRPRVCFVAGTRPEAIKIAPVVDAMRSDGRLNAVLISSGQHVAPVEQALAAFGLVPDVVLPITRTTGSLAELTALLGVALDRAFAADAPDAVVVQGDTSTAMVGALAAFWRRIPVVHLEAGLRSGDLTAPFPEEANRKIIDHICAMHLAPTRRAAEHLAREGIDGDRVIVTGNTVVDAVMRIAALNLPYDDERLDRIETTGRRIVLVTVHRRESWGEPLRNVLQAVRELIQRHHDIDVVLPVHPNPAVRAEVESVLNGMERVLICDPLSYPSMARLISKSYLALSDSGGVQEEAPSFGVPVLVLRDVTERWEAIEAGCARLVGTNVASILDAASELLARPELRQRMVSRGNPFGDGRAAQRTVDAIAWSLGRGERPTPFDESELAPIPVSVNRDDGELAESRVVGAKTARSRTSSSQTLQVGNAND